MANNEGYNYTMTNFKLKRIEINSMENHEYLAGKVKSSLNDLLRGNLEEAGVDRTVGTGTEKCWQRKQRVEREWRLRQML